MSAFHVLLLSTTLLTWAPPVLAVDEVPIDYERLSDRVLIVKCGKVSFDMVIAIASQKGIVVIDTGTAPSLAAEYRKIIERELERDDFIYVINTHYHYDHTNGNGVFKDAVIISHGSSPQRLREFQEGLAGFIDSRRAMIARYKSQIEGTAPGSDDAQRGKDIVYTYGRMIEDLEKDFHVTLPTLTFSDRMTLDLGDLTLKLVYFGEGRHTGDDIMILCPEEKLLFTGDLFFDNSMQISYRPQFDAERWLEALDYVLEDESQVELALSTHTGKIKASYVRLWRDYLFDLWKSLTEAKEKGVTTLSAIQKKFPYKPGFSYLEKSGLDPEQLRREHQANLRYTFYCVNGTKSAAEALEETLEPSPSVEALERKIQEIRAARDDKLYFDETEFNRLGYRLLNQNRVDEAIAVFKLNVDLYPEAFNTYDSLGEAYMVKGEKELAVKNYQRSLELNPDNANAVQMLERLKQ
jgi:glyoxylase-like metal-dependent hydrolase (beta-lactamase superfamily II)